MRFGTRHILTVIIVSVAILGAITAMYVFQPESTVTCKQDTVDTAPLAEFAVNFPRKGVQVDQVS